MQNDLKDRQMKTINLNGHVYQYYYDENSIKRYTLVTNTASQAVADQNSMAKPNLTPNTHLGTKQENANSY